MEVQATQPSLKHIYTAETGYPDPATKEMGLEIHAKTQEWEGVSKAFTAQGLVGESGKNKSLRMSWEAPNLDELIETASLPPFSLIISV